MNDRLNRDEIGRISLTKVRAKEKSPCASIRDIQRRSSHLRKNAELNEAPTS